VYQNRKDYTSKQVGTSTPTHQAKTETEGDTVTLRQKSNAAQPQFGGGVLSALAKDLQQPHYENINWEKRINTAAINGTDITEFARMLANEYYDDINEQDFWKHQTWLMKALENGHYNHARLLLTWNANPDVEDINHRKAADYIPDTAEGRQFKADMPKIIDMSTRMDREKLARVERYRTAIADNHPRVVNVDDYYIH